MSQAEADDAKRFRHQAVGSISAKVSHVWRTAVDKLPPATQHITKSVDRLTQKIESGHEEALKAARELTRKVRDDQRRIEQGIRTALTRVRVVASDEIRELERRVDLLGDRLERIVKGRQSND